MTADPNVDTVTGREDEVLSLLNEAYDDWGDEEYFRWKYDQYPEYDPEEHTFAVVDDELAAFRRVFRKELVYEGESVTTFVLGDTAVAPDHQGQGLYSNLHERTTNYCEDVGAEATITYNNADNVTFKANRKRGWEFSVLPLRLYVHSYETVLSQYAEMALPDGTAIDPVVDRIGDRFVLEVDGRRVPIASIFGTERTPDSLRLEVSASPRAVARFVEAASNGQIARTIPTAARLFASGDLSLTGGGNRAPSNGRADGVDVLEPDAVSDEERETMVELHRLSRAGAPTFRRDLHDVEHLLSYPGADVLVARQDSDIVGFAVVGPYENDGVLEARVLDLVAPSETIYRRLVTRIERHTATAGYDLLVMMSDRDPGAEWASIERQTIMWNRCGDSRSVPADRLFPPTIGMYDVL
ncbi:GNAT family N-acetyltransferase [Natrialba sp. INN-245]|uniref:GNAT family N-acetyltransferase n=1 Tax=Natrialba sp. INN-245 TaxID=2690967 RepID=UPI00131395BA|nr:GNAT family N-acetyltransferase [Natrialba sp. INN-245]MWV40039.1 GNAT family N-acetyltransferase [Natrialba sp. INN-245]